MTRQVSTPGPSPRPRPMPSDRRFLPPPPYPPGQAALPARRRQTRHSPVLAPLLAFMGLLAVGSASVWGMAQLGLDLDGAAGAGPQASPLTGAVVDPSGAPRVTPTLDPVDAEPVVPADIIEAPPDQRAEVKGTIVFGRDGDLWAASGQELRRLTNTAGDTVDSAPAWSPDGKHIYFVRTSRRTVAKGKTRPGGQYTFYIPDVMRIDADGSNRKPIYRSLIRGPGGLWFSHVLQPDVSPDGKTLVVTSDGPDGTGPVVLHTLKAKGGRLSKVSAPSIGELGHNDPAFSPDGTRIAYTRNRAKGDTGSPVVAIHTCKNRRDCEQGKTKLLRAGFANPSWSPDGTWLAVEATTGQGRDIALINAQKGDVRFKLTDDGDSFAPVVSPNGDQIAYLHRDGLDIDLRVMTLSLDATGTFTLVDDRPVTSDGAIDGDSTPAWYIPPEQLTRPLVPDPGGDPLADAGFGSGEEAALPPA